MALLGKTSLDVFPLCLGGNVFGWTADRDQSFAVLDAYAEAGGNFIDTADVYSAWVPGHVGGESETIIGEWMAARSNRARMVIATKVGHHDGPSRGLRASTIREGVEGSLRRLRTDYIDLYYAHVDDPATDMHETVRAFDALVREGKVRHLGASNYPTARLSEAIGIAKFETMARYDVIQPHYNLMERRPYEDDLSIMALREQLACVPYFALAKGFLTGKYRPGGRVDSARAEGARAYLDDRGLRVLAALDTIAAAHQTTVAAVALAWLRDQPTVVAPIASARTVEQLRDLLPMATLALTGEERTLLHGASV
ncbi:MAG: aldo/keto reductase [Myxococcales bacterium]|nr:MAG: aldo/keto reductase [Myxococcales bacterium]